MWIERFRPMWHVALLYSFLSYGPHAFVGFSGTVPGTGTWYRTSTVLILTKSSTSQDKRGLTYSTGTVWVQARAQVQYCTGLVQYSLEYRTLDLTSTLYLSVYIYTRFAVLNEAPYGVNPQMPVSNRPTQKDGDQAKVGLSVHRTKSQRPPGPGAPRGDIASGPCYGHRPFRRTVSSPGACWHSPSRTPSQS